MTAYVSSSLCRTIGSGRMRGSGLGSGGDVDESNHFTFFGNCGRGFLCLGKRD